MCMTIVDAEPAQIDAHDACCICLEPLSDTTEFDQKSGFHICEDLASFCEQRYSFWTGGRRNNLDVSSIRE